MSVRVAHFDRRAVQPDELRVHRCVEGTPVVPALGLGGPGRQAVGADPAGRRRTAVRAPVEDRAGNAKTDRVHGGLVGVDAACVPLQPQVVVDARVVRLGGRFDQRRGDVAVLIEHVRRQPLLHDRDHGLGLGLRLGQEVAVQVEVVAVRPLVGDPPVRVLIDVPEQDHVVQDGVDLGIRAVRRRRQPLDQLEHGVHAF